ncbi:MAG: HD domain-containing protein, partial [Candidatus Dadabacteria bacterium]
MAFKRQRIRDPLHNLVEFQADEFENVMWRVLQTAPFQRLRRIKQLGFSELVYPGATHTRFAHSVGVFHTARLLLNIIKAHLGSTRFEPSRANIALAAALVHDLGHGPFSHAFEDVGRRFSLKMANHERLSDVLIRSREVSDVLRNLGSGFASDVADVIGSAGPKNIYGAIVSSQFDADRLDYMRRDRLMTGTHHGGIDFDWLLSNIEIGEVPYGVDEQRIGKVETFVLGPKATYAAESYLAGLFHLYPTVYFHKATRGAEKLFAEILSSVIQLVRSDRIEATGIGPNHPLIQFAREPDKVENILHLDDTVIWGALSMMCNAEDATISEFSKRLRDRHLLKAFDVRERIAQLCGNSQDRQLIDKAALA